MTPSNPTSIGSAGVRDPDAVLASALDAWRDDVAALAASPDLGARVLRAVANSSQAAALAREDELDRVRRVARLYASAAAVLLAVGVGGALTVRHTAGERPAAASALAELELHRMSLVGLDSVADLPLGGR